MAAQEATPEAVVLELRESYATPDRLVLVRYPDDWVIEVYETPPSIINANIATNASAIDKNVAGTGRFGPFRGGEALLQVLLLDICTLNAPNIRSEMSAAEILYNSYARFSQPNIEYGEIEPTTAQGKMAARLLITSEDMGEGIMIVTKFEPCVIATFTVTTGVGELPRWEPTFLAFVEAVTYASSAEHLPEPAALALNQTYQSEDGQASLNYPAGWVLNAAETLPNAILNLSVGSSESVLRKLITSPDAIFAPGEVQVQIVLGTAKEIAGHIFGTAPHLNAAQFLQSLVKAASTFDIDFGIVTSITVGEWPAASIPIHAGTRGDGLLLVIKRETNIFVIIGTYFAPGEIDHWRPTALAIAESITYTPMIEAALSGTTHRSPATKNLRLKSECSVT